MSLPGLDADIHYPGKRHCGECIDIRCGQPATTDELPVLKMLVEEIHEDGNLPAALLAPGRVRGHAIFEVPAGVLEAHARRHEKMELNPAQPLFNPGLFKRSVAQQRRAVWTGFLKIAAKD